MALTFAAAQARLGPAVIRRLGNARMAVAGGPTLDGIFTRAPATAALGSRGMRSRNVTFEYLTDYTPVSLVPGTLVTVYVGDQLTTPAGTYRVLGEPVDQLETGLTHVDLEAGA